MDSISMLLREIFELHSFRRGNIDIVKTQFRQSVSHHSSQLNQFFSENANWLRRISEFRDRLIHRHRIPIFIKDKDSDAVYLIQYLETSKKGKKFDAIFMTEKKVDNFLHKEKLCGSKRPFTYAYYKQPITMHELKNKSHSHLPNDYIPLLDFCSDSFDLTIKLIELVFTELHAVLSRK